MEVSSSDPELIRLEAKIVRMGRAQYGLSATVDWNYDATEETMVEFTILYSTSGDKRDYKLLPWAIPKQSLYHFLSTFYKDRLMDKYESCTNMPHIKDKFEPPWLKQKYYADKCVDDGKGVMDVVPPGFYKFILNCTGPDQPSWGAVGLYKITTKFF
ncbi:uncharacterized protein LOC108090336 [Drosophila ficusphila]|uniref:uncharacterized protein LOC108090336 n=1 Tax=Drosophila ficusphila TaxID=30025 RepID=UPI001C89A0C3|nr:uncharacterized protein LOC108090336 [Drosophila ficusphila]